MVQANLLASCLQYGSPRSLLSRKSADRTSALDLRTMGKGRTNLNDMTIGSPGNQPPTPGHDSAQRRAAPTGGELADILGVVADVTQGTQVNGSGGNTQINVHTVPSQASPWPVVVGSIPALATAFQPRSDIRAMLVSANKSSSPGIVPTYALVGWGGTGKTQLAASIAFRALAGQDGRRDLVIWVTAAARGAVQSTYAEAARRLAVPGATGDDVGRDADVLLSWLTTTRKSWLVVLDDITDVRDVDDLWPRGLGGNGLVVATTRRKEPRLGGAERILVDVRTFTPEESMAYLTDRLSSAGFGHLLDDSVANLAETLGHLPLALSHAAAYLIRKQRLTCADYLSRYTQQSTSLEELLPGWADTETYGRPVTVTLTLGLEAANALQPRHGASAVLQVASMLDPAGHPVQLWDTRPIAAFVGEVTADESVSRQDVSDEGVWDACLALHSYGLLHLDAVGGHRAVSVHAVTARAVRESISREDFPSVVEAAADALSDLWPTHAYMDAALVAVLRANVDSLVRSAGDQLWKSGRYSVAFRAGESLFDVGLRAAAVTYWRRMTDAAVRHLGPEHPDVLTARRQLGSALGHSGDAAAAVAMLQDVAAAQSHRLGSEHPSTLTTLHDLARWRGHAGDASGALAAITEVLAVRLSVLGPQHLDTLTSRATLARWRGETGDAVAAAVGLSELLDDVLAELGQDHPVTLKTRNNLAYWRGEAGDAAGAAEALEALLNDRLRVLGPDHPDTLNTRNNLAYWRGEAGDSAGAAHALARLVVDRTRILGADHPHTLASRSNHAYWRGKAGDAASAAAEFRNILRDRINILGPDHPDTLDTRANLARWSGEADPSIDTAAAFEALLVDRLRVLGPEHPHTLTTKHEVARWHGHGGNPQAAVRGLAAVTSDRVRILGPDHPDTLATRHELARWQGEVGDRDAAIAGLEAVLADRLRVLGANHPHTLISLAELGRWRAAVGDIDAAMNITERAVEGRLRVLGENHPDTQAARQQLDRLREVARRG